MSMKLGKTVQFDTLKEIGCRPLRKNAPKLFLDWGTRLQASTVVVLITSRKIVI